MSLPTSGYPTHFVFTRQVTVTFWVENSITCLPDNCIFIPQGSQLNNFVYSMSHSASGLPTDFFMFTFPSSFHLSTVSPSIRVANSIIYVNLTTLASSILPLGTLNICFFTLTVLFSFRVANSIFFFLPDNCLFLLQGSQRKEILFRRFFHA